MEAANDNGNSGHSPSHDNHNVEEKSATRADLNSSSSSLVTKQKLLTREEECTLKTALAFVILKTRAKAQREKQSTKGVSLDAYDGNNPKRQRIHDTSNSSMIPSSVLDHLFRPRSNPHLGSPSYNPSHPRSLTSLSCTGSRTHIDHMFRAAKTLAETLLVTIRKYQHQTTPSTFTSKALAGATGHLAHQLQLLLTTTTKHSTSTPTVTKGLASSGASVTSLSTAGAKSSKSAGKRSLISATRYNRRTLSSNATISSTSTLVPPSTSRVGDDASVVLVTPTTNQSKKKTNNNKTAMNENPSKANIPERNGNGESVDNSVPEWIRSSLLQKNCVPTVESSSVSPDANVTTILDWRKTTVLDILASFQVYTVMVPQIATISPPLIGHIFQVVAKLVRDIYHDRVIVAITTMDQSGKAKRRRLLDHLATSALKLLRLCWTTKIPSFDAEHAHRSFLLLSLQEILADMLAPLSRSELAREHYRLTMMEVSRKRRCQRQQYQRQRWPSEYRQQEQQTFLGTEKTTNHGMTPAASVRKTPVQQQGIDTFAGACLYLEPESKILLRITVYRMMLLEGR